MIIIGFFIYVVFYNKIFVYIYLFFGINVLIFVKKKGFIDLWGFVLKSE